MRPNIDGDQAEVPDGLYVDEQGELRPGRLRTLGETVTFSPSSPRRART